MLFVVGPGVAGAEVSRWPRRVVVVVCVVLMVLFAAWIVRGGAAPLGSRRELQELASVGTSYVRR